MIKAKSILLIGFLNSFFLVPTQINAQIIPDKTLPSNSSLATQSNIIFINGGTTQGHNLFHSFSQFNIPQGSIVRFNNGTKIRNIFSRITGNQASTINGILAANGPANLFLINANGIRFGENARLAIGGSFYATTAERIQFADGQSFSTHDKQPPLLSSSLPQSLNFQGGTPGEIIVQGNGHNLIGGINPVIGAGQQGGLTVIPRNSLNLIGGSVVLNGGVLTANSGAITVGSVRSGAVVLSPFLSQFTLTPAPTAELDSLQLQNRALIDTSGIGGGAINLFARDISLRDGSVALNVNIGVLDSAPIHINATRSLFISGTDPIARIPGGIGTSSLGAGRSGNIFVSTPQLTLTEGGTFTSFSFSPFPTGQSGDIQINAQSVDIIGTSPRSAITASSILSIATGRASAGNISINTGVLNLRDGGVILSFSGSLDRSGQITIHARDVNLSGLVFGTRFPSGIGSTTAGFGSGTGVEINTERLLVENGARIDASTIGQGNAGSIVINARQSVTVRGVFPGTSTASTITSSASSEDPILFGAFPNIPRPILGGNAGTVFITTPQLNVNDHGVLSVRNDGPGTAGDLRITANQIWLNGGKFLASTQSGDGGNIAATATSLILLDRQSSVSASARGLGEGGNIGFVAPITFLRDSSVSANAQQAQAGQITINTRALLANNKSLISASSDLGPQFAGLVAIDNQSIEFTRPAIPIPTVKPPALAALCAPGETGASLVVRAIGGELVNLGRPLSDRPTPDNTTAVSWVENPDGTIRFIGGDQYLAQAKDKLCPPAKSS